MVDPEAVIRAEELAELDEAAVGEFEDGEGRADGGRSGPSRDIAVYGIGLVVGQVLSALTTPLFTRQLGPSEFGSLELLTVVSTLLATCVLAGSDLAAIRVYHEVEGRPARRRVMTTGLASVSVLGLLAFGLSVALAPVVGDLLVPGGGGTVAVIVGGAWVAVSSVATYSIEILRVLDKGWAFLWSGLLRSALGSAVAVVLVLTLANGVTAVYAGLLVGAAIAAVFNLVAGRELVGGRPSRATAKRMLAYGLPLIPTGLAAWSMMLVDRIILAADRSVTEVGYYAVANRIAALMLLAVYGFRAGWSAWSLKEHHVDPEGERVARARALTGLVAGVAWFGVALAAPAREAILVVGGEAYLPATDALPYLVIGLVLFATIPVTQTGLTIHHRTRTMALHSSVAAGVNAVACLVLVAAFGIVGAAIATLIGFAWQAVGYAVGAQRVDRAPFRWDRVILTIGLMIPWCLLGPLEIGGSFWSSLLVKGIAVLLFPVVLRLVGVLEPGSAAVAVQAVKRKLGRGSDGEGPDQSRSVSEPSGPSA